VWDGGRYVAQLRREAKPRWGSHIRHRPPASSPP
jgi:hypothetical protein